jgi:hypothetical protein
MKKYLLPVLFSLSAILVQPTYALEGTNDPNAVNIENNGNEGTNNPDVVNIENGGNEGTNDPADVDIDSGGNEGTNDGSADNETLGDGH